MNDSATRYSISLKPRKFQKEIVELAERRDGKLYVVSPPGSGKTITALMIAARSNATVLVLAPNTAIQEQWIDKSRFFTPDGSLAASDDPFDALPITALTYQALARPGEPSREDRLAVLSEWKSEIMDENALSAEDAEKWLQEYETRNPERFQTSFLRRWKSKRLSSDADDNILSEDAEDFLRRISDGVRVDLIVFDECHHLAGYWAQVAIKTVDRWGRRPLMLLGSGGLMVTYAILGACYFFGLQGPVVSVVPTAAQSANQVVLLEIAHGVRVPADRRQVVLHQQRSPGHRAKPHALVQGNSLAVEGPGHRLDALEAEPANPTQAPAPEKPPERSSTLV